MREAILNPNLDSIPNPSLDATFTDSHVH